MPQYDIRYYYADNKNPDNVWVLQHSGEADSVSEAYSRFEPDKVASRWKKDKTILEDIQEHGNFLNWVVFEKGATHPADWPPTS